MSSPKQYPKPYIRETLTSRALHFAGEETQSRMLLADPDLLALDYTRLMMGCLLFVPDPRRIMMLGLGGGSLAKFCHRWLPQARIDVVEINPHVVALRRDFLVPDDDARFTVHLDDGARHVRTVRDELDVLLLDAYDIDGVPAVMQSRRFLDDCRRALRTHGVFVANLNVDHAYTAALVAAIRSRVGATLVVDDAERSNRVVLAVPDGRLATTHIGAIERPEHLAPQAWAQLVVPFARIRAAQQVQ